MRHRLPVLIALSVWLSTACVPTGAPPAKQGQEEGLPSIPLVTLDGASTDLRSALHGRVAVVSFWATWCDACVDEIAALERLHEQARVRDDAVVIAVAVGEPRETVAEFARKRRIGYEQLVDESFQLADALGQQRVPATLVVDHAGHIVFRGGALDPAGLAAFRTALQAVRSQ